MRQDEKRKHRIDSTKEHAKKQWELPEHGIGIRTDAGTWSLSGAGCMIKLGDRVSGSAREPYAYHVPVRPYVLLFWLLPPTDRYQVVRLLLEGANVAVCTADTVDPTPPTIALILPALAVTFTEILVACFE